MTPLPVGTLVGDYEVVRPLGRGGMGEVYEGLHPVIGKRVAIKVLHARAADALVEARRLLDEARVVNAISHPGIVDIFGAHVLPDGRPCLVMDFLEGETFAQLCARRGPLPMEEVFSLLEGVLPPLIAVHRAGVIHRDVKPSNLFLEQTAEGPRVKLLDFGVARRVDRSSPLTNPELTLGSLGFMGPEQLRGETVPQSDLYAVGCVAWVLLTGKPVFPADRAEVLLASHFHQQPPPLEGLRADVTPELSFWVSWLLEKRPEQRPFNAEVALAALREAAVMSLGEATVSMNVSFPDLARDLDRRARTRASDVTRPVRPVDPARTLADDDPETRPHVKR